MVSDGTGTSAVTVTGMTTLTVPAALATCMVMELTPTWAADGVQVMFGMTVVSCELVNCPGVNTTPVGPDTNERVGAGWAYVKPSRETAERRPFARRVLSRC